MQETGSLIESLESLPESQRKKIVESLSNVETRALLGELDEIYKQDPWLWLTEEVFTKDEATQQKLPWPDKAYLKDVVKLLDSERLIVIPKSRRMMISWLVAAWATYKARFFPNNAIFIQSETEQKSSFITDQRCVYIEKNLREPLLRRAFKTIKTHQGSIGRILYTDTDSYIRAIAQGGSVIRTYTFSLLFMDESDFQADGQDALNAALSIAEKKSQIVLVTTSDGPRGVVAEICRTAGFTKWN